MHEFFSYPSTWHASIECCIQRLLPDFGDSPFHCPTSIVNTCMKCVFTNYLIFFVIFREKGSEIVCMSLYLVKSDAVFFFLISNMLLFFIVICDYHTVLKLLRTAEAQSVLAKIFFQFNIFFFSVSQVGYLTACGQFSFVCHHSIYMDISAVLYNIMFWLYI